MRTVLCAVLLVGCGSDDSSEPPPDALEDIDPLASLTSEAAPGSLDDLHERIIAQRCSGQPGLCHNGQFEPNLSTPALTYAYVVNRPGIEKSDRLRVKPGDSASSLFIDKIKGINGVATQMPLGAEPLEAADVAELEAWINGGALRTPDSAPAPQLNNPPRRPEIAIFNASGTRLDGTGPVRVAPGTTLVLRHSVQDFETADSAIPFAAVILSLGDNNDVVINPTALEDQHIGGTTFDPAGPDGQGDKLNYRFTWTIPAQLDVRDNTTLAITQRAAVGQNVTVTAVYVDGSMPNIVAIDFATSPIEIRSN
jgi:hypothetical protein